MIDDKSTTYEWIVSTSENGRINKVLLEKMIRALTLLDGLAESDLDFVFKGGTSLVLLLHPINRISIDIDIITSDEKELNEILQKICDDKGFLRFEKDARKHITAIEKEHYKLYYKSVINEDEEYVLLDVLRENILYTKILTKEIRHEFIEISGNPNVIQIPDINNLLGDKLTAFAPNTTGIPYQKNGQEMGMQIIKQMFDIGCLFDEADDIKVVSDVFSKFTKAELSYKGLDAGPNDVLDDIIETALLICLETEIKNEALKILKQGIVSVRSYIFSGRFNENRAKIAASKTAYVASAIKYGGMEINKFHSGMNVRDLEIAGALDTKITRIMKKANPEAFFYLYQISLLLNEES
ncbi:hypothetical protein MmiAt1_07000 [Methanimicrococcus sp. At1]|uniref:Nucleotidyl transferase AbiEii/AbiGii toxin family protein n=1 Tax=Methanimicrococcus hacksteinii TaxID=3028293 RepID=A0ABU3VP07_9EURY|nr:nucleotidyl transferase AbiEii/AbiGii toxin family protein [Methanimicrococcus sp. At1]MDV0445143.1 hypothetical protein [Methanimicrococcus sp. At1]